MHILRADNASDAVHFAPRCRDEGEFAFFRAGRPDAGRSRPACYAWRPPSGRTRCIA